MPVTRVIFLLPAYATYRVPVLDRVFDAIGNGFTVLTLQKRCTTISELALDMGRFPQTILKGLVLNFDSFNVFDEGMGSSARAILTPRLPKYLGIDEIAVVKGQGKYYGVLVNLETHQPITLLPSRTQAALRQVFSQWGAAVLEGIEGVSIDLWKPYQSLVEEMMPNATVVADRFHVTKLLNEELDNQRKAEKRAAKKITKKADRKRVLEGLNGSKYVLLRNEKDLNERQREKLIEVGKVSPKLATMYRLKEEFREIFESSENWAGGTLRLLDWMADSSTFFKQSCGTIKRWFDEVTSYFELRITNGVVEGINNKLKLIKRLGYGFSNFDNFKLRGLLPWVFPFKTA